MKGVTKLLCRVAVTAYRLLELKLLINMLAAVTVEAMMEDVCMDEL